MVLLGISRQIEAVASSGAKTIVPLGLSVTRASHQPKASITTLPNAIGLRLAYWVAEVCNADARDHRRVAKDGWRAGEVVEESNSGAKKKRRDVDVEFVEEASIQQLLDGVSAVDPDGLPCGGGFG